MDVAYYNDDYVDDIPPNFHVVERLIELSVKARNMALMLDKIPNMAFEVSRLTPREFGIVQEAHKQGRDVTYVLTYPKYIKAEQLLREKCSVEDVMATTGLLAAEVLAIKKRLRKQYTDEEVPQKVKNVIERLVNLNHSPFFIMTYPPCLLLSHDQLVALLTYYIGKRDNIKTTRKRRLRKQDISNGGNDSSGKSGENPKKKKKKRVQECPN